MARVRMSLHSLHRQDLKQENPTLSFTPAQGSNHNVLDLSLSPPPAQASERTLYCLSGIFLFFTFLAAGLGTSYLLSPLICNKTWWYIGCEERYRYLIPILIPVTAWFGIANWVGWEYFRNA
ncbi:hypothetical protein M231_04412 [Tremella mesenterica]|uniref:Uncharacterized protein n=1 Tax=Tremella mesenterica TaxID=5217 RepID=A0A4Q1BL23_TREME|nr:hypothetical protein M231_04412 [Tremella mesenterica]